MKRVDFEIFDEMAHQINSVIKKYGLRSRADFFRYAAIEFIRREQFELKNQSPHQLLHDQ